jgi:exoribonuclease R
MPARRIRVDPVETVRDGVAAILAEAKVPTAFSPAALEEAERAAPDLTGRVDLREVGFFTIDPPGSMDLDQAMALERTDGGFRVRYAIADVGAVVTPGGAIDTESRERGTTIYLPDGKVPLHPPVLSEDRASLLPGQERPALVWDLGLAADGELLSTRLDRALVRSRERFTYDEAQQRIADEPFALLAEIGALRQARARARGAVELSVPEQEVKETPEGWTVSYRVGLPVEDFNAQISLLTGMAAAKLMHERGVGVVRAQDVPEEKSMRRLRCQADAFGVPWPTEMPYPEFIRSLDPAQPRHAALMHEAAGVGHGARYVAFTDGPPEGADHFALAMPYAHVTAPLRRLVDRYALALCLDDPPAWAREGLEGLPEAMAAGDRRAKSVERAVVDLVEAVLLSGRVGETFAGVAVDEDTVQLTDIGVRAKVEGCPTAGERLQVTLAEADPARRLVRFARA